MQTCLLRMSSVQACAGLVGSGFWEQRKVLLPTDSICAFSWILQKLATVLKFVQNPSPSIADLHGFHLYVLKEVFQMYKIVIIS